MTHCYNCGHAGTFVLLVQCALAVPGPDAPVRDRAGPDRVDSRRREEARYRDDPGYRGDPHRRSDPCDRDSSRRETDSRRRDDPNCGTRSNRRDRDDSHRRLGRGADLPPEDHPSLGDHPTLGNLPGLEDLPTLGDVSLAVQCPACDSTDVGVAATDLLARYGSNTTS